MENKRVIFGDFPQLREIAGVLSHVNKRATVVPEHQELTVKTNINAGGLDEGGVQRLDNQAPGSNLFFDSMVAQYHLIPPDALSCIVAYPGVGKGIVCLGPPTGARSGRVCALVP